MALDRLCFASQSEEIFANTTMKTLARTGAVLSLSFFTIPALWLLSQSTPDAPALTIFGLCLLGVATFLGSLLWLLGEKCCSTPDRR